MAFVNGAITVSFTFQDDDLATATTSVNLQPGTSLADAHTFASNYVDLMLGVSDCALIKYNVTEEIYNDVFPTGAPGSDVEDKGVVTIRTANNSSSKISWPGVLETILMNTITPPGTYIDLTNLAVAALLDAMINGLVVGALTLQPTARNGSDFRSVKEAYKQNRGSQKSREYKG